MWEEIKKELRDDPDPPWVKWIGYPLFVAGIVLITFL